VTPDLWTSLEASTMQNLNPTLFAEANISERQRLGQIIYLKNNPSIQFNSRRTCSNDLPTKYVHQYLLTWPNEIRLQSLNVNALLTLYVTLSFSLNISCLPVLTFAVIEPAGVIQGGGEFSVRFLPLYVNYSFR